MGETQLVPLSIHSEDNGSVVVFEEGTVPFPVRRTFVVTADMNQIRGDHAHRVCNQLLVVLKGKVLVSVDDGTFAQELLLTELAKGLLIPPMVWATQKYVSADAILLVACDQLYDETDYIRDYAEFKRVVSTKPERACW